MAKILFGAEETDMCIAYHTFVDVLCEDGHRVMKVYSADAVLEAMAAGDTDLVVVEGPMKWGSLGRERTKGGCIAGYVAVEAARSQGNNTPAIFLKTAWRPPKVVGTRVLQIPCRLAHFRRTVRELLKM